MSYVQDFPGIPASATNSREFAINRTVLYEILVGDLENFFNKNPIFEDMRQHVLGKLKDLEAARIIFRDGNIYRFTPGCPNCRRPRVAELTRKFCVKFQTRFLAAWSDPTRRDRMINDLTRYMLDRHPIIEQKKLDLVVIAHRQRGVKTRCLLYSTEGE